MNPPARGSLLRACSTLGCPEASLAEALALARRHGLEAIEVRALGGTIDLPAHFLSQFGSPAAFAEALRGAPARILSLNTSWHLGEDCAAARAAFLEFVPWAEAAGIPWLRVFDGREGAGEEEYPRAARGAAWWRELRRERGWRADLMVETHGLCVRTPEILRFFAAVPDVALLWDTHHTWRKGGENPVETWRAIRARVVHVHVKDSVAARGAAPPYAFVLPGAGEFPMAGLNAALRADGYAGGLSLEWEKLWHPELPSLDEALAAAAAARWW